MHYRHPVTGLCYAECDVGSIGYYEDSSDQYCVTESEKYKFAIYS